MPFFFKLLDFQKTFFARNQTVLADYVAMYQSKQSLLFRLYDNQYKLNLLKTKMTNRKIIKIDIKHNVKITIDFGFVFVMKIVFNNSLPLQYIFFIN